MSKKKKSDAAVATVDGVITMKDLCERYLATLERKGAGPGTIASYSMELKLAMRELGEATLVADLTIDRVKSYFESDAVTKTRAGVLKAKPTVDKTRRVLRLALACGVELGYLPDWPIRMLEAKA